MSEGELKKRFDIMFHDPDYEMSEATIFRLNVNLDEAKQEYPSLTNFYHEDHIVNENESLKAYITSLQIMLIQQRNWYKKWFGGE